MSAFNTVKHAAKHQGVLFKIEYFGVVWSVIPFKILALSCKRETGRLHFIEHMDSIIVLDRGEIAEIGSHDDLMKREGVYKELYSLQ